MQNSEISGIVLEDFDTAFSNNFYHSHLDDSCKFVFIIIWFAFLCLTFALIN